MELMKPNYYADAEWVKLSFSEPLEMFLFASIVLVWYAYVARLFPATRRS